MLNSWIIAIAAIAFGIACYAWLTKRKRESVSTDPSQNQDPRRPIEQANNDSDPDNRSADTSSLIRASAHEVEAGFTSHEAHALPEEKSSIDPASYELVKIADEEEVESCLPVPSESVDSLPLLPAGSESIFHDSQQLFEDNSPEGRAGTIVGEIPAVTQMSSSDADCDLPPVKKASDDLQAPNDCADERDSTVECDTNLSPVEAPLPTITHQGAGELEELVQDDVSGVLVQEVCSTGVRISEKTSEQDCTLQASIYNFLEGTASTVELLPETPEIGSVTETPGPPGCQSEDSSLGIVPTTEALDESSSATWDSQRPAVETPILVEQKTFESTDNGVTSTDRRPPEPKRRRPPQYRPSIRTARTTQRTKRTQPTSSENSRQRSFGMSVQIVFDRRNRCRFTLLPERKEDLAEQIHVIGPNGEECWDGYQDEWYSGVSLPNLSQVLEQGCEWNEVPSEWKSDFSAEYKLRWVLSGREIFVLAPNSTISGFVSASRLILFEEHLVLCTARQENSVRTALTEAGCSEFVTLTTANGVFPGWVLFRGVRPTIALHHEDSAGMLNVLRPVHDVEIVFRGGIRLARSLWLNGHPPQIHIRGEIANGVEVTIDGLRASDCGGGKFTAQGWDTANLHTVFCGGKSQVYQLDDGIQEWDGFDAFTYQPNCTQVGGKSITICGPIVSLGHEAKTASLTPASNTCLIGPLPGQITFSSQPFDVRMREFLAIADFPVVWTIPANPLRCDKSSTCVKLLQRDFAGNNWDIPAGVKNGAVMRWCRAILDASRRRLVIEPDTDEARNLWALYKKEAHSLWKRLR